MDEEIEYKKTNREKRKTPKTGKGWCDTCDRSFKGEAEKCPVCGKRHNFYKRYKKE